VGKQSLHQLIEVKGYNNIKYLMLFTEPLNYSSGIIPKGFTQEEYYEKICRKINDKLVEAGLRTKIKIVGLTAAVPGMPNGLDGA